MKKVTFLFLFKTLRQSCYKVFICLVLFSHFAEVKAQDQTMTFTDDSESATSYSEDLYQITVTDGAGIYLDNPVLPDVTNSVVNLYGSSTKILEPATVGTYKSFVIDAAENVSAASTVAFRAPLPPPTITSFTPTSGAIGTSVTITGAGFNTTPANNIVFFGATKATVSASTSTSITVTVPSGATYQPITVLSNGLIASSASPFITTFGGSGIDATSFAIKTDLIPRGNAYSVAIGDLDGDGKPDLAVANQGSTFVSVFRNTSTGDGTVSYATKVDFSTGTNPLSIAIGDLDGDGKLDLAVANGGNGSVSSVSVLRNTSTSGVIDANSFAPKVDFTAGIYLASVAIGDLDGDGKLDLAVVSQNGFTVSVFRNTSTGAGTVSYATKVDFTTGANSFPNSVAIGDLDGDGKLDLAVTNQISTTVSVFRNTSTGAGTVSYAAKVDYATESSPICVAIADLDGDGKSDFVVANSNNTTISVFRNTSTSGVIDVNSFTPKVDYATGTHPNSVAIGDLDGDGKLDLAVTNRISYNVSVFRNTSTAPGTVSYATQVLYATGTNSSPYSVAIGDMDGDGKSDLAVVNNGFNTVSVFRNTVTPPPALTSVAVPTNGTYITSQDLDFTVNFNDNITVVTTGGTPQIALTIGGTTRQAVYQSGSTTSALLFRYEVLEGDLDADGIVVGTLSANGGTLKDAAGNNATLTLNSVAATTGVLVDAVAPTNQNTVYASSSSALVGTAVTIVSSADAANNVWFAPAGTTTFVAGATMTKAANGTATTILAPAFGGLYKLFVIDAVGNVSDASTATLTATLPPPTIASFTPTSGAIGTSVTITGTNFNTIPANNIVFFGATKAIVSTATATSLTVTVPAGATYGPLSLIDLSVNKNISSNKFFTPTFSPSKGVLTASDFSTEQSFSTGTTEPNKIAATGDLDGDGKPDIIIADDAGKKTLILRNTGGNGTASFETALTITTSGNQTSLNVGDIDGDGKLDLVEVDKTDSSFVSVYLNTTVAVGSISFSAATNLITGANNHKLRNVAISDLDGDGKADIAVVNNEGNVLLYRNTGSVGTVSFAAKVEYAAGTGPQGIMIGDIDSDGLPDLAITNADSNGTSVRVLRNTSTSGTFSFVNSGNFTTGGGPYDLALGDLDGDGKLDIATVNHSGQNVSVLVNTSTSGTVSFATKTDFAIGRSAQKIALGDLNGDGKLDVVVTQSGATIIIFTNTTTTAGSVTFAPMIEVAGTGNSLQAIISDLDGDGKTDFATGGSKKIIVFHNADPLENADLEALSISGDGTLSPTFTPSTTAYTAIVSNAITSISVTPTQTTSNATATIQVRVNAGSYVAVASASASDPLGLIVGSNTIDVKVTSPDGTAIKMYAITVIREMPVPSYIVSGAGTAAVNGVYTYFGKKKSNKQVWQYGSYYLTSDSYYAWISTATSGGSYGSVYVTSHSGETDPTKWIMGTDWSTSGAAPNPIIELAASTVTYASSELTENSANDGTVIATTIITHNNYESATFTGTDGENFVTSGKAVVTGVPTGLTAVIIRNNNLQLTFSLTGNASAHANDISNLNITFQNSAFSDSDAANTINYDTNLSINFIEHINVGSGQTYTTIQSAVNAAGNGDVLLLAAETFTEQNITITDKSLKIIGVSPVSTIIQAHAVAGSATDRVFNITHSSYAETNFNSFEKLTIRHGNVANSNGNDRGGALFVYHTTLNLKDCAIESNRVGTTGWGGYGVGGAGVYVQISNLISENCTYYDNHHTSESRTDLMGGGAIAFFPDTQVNYMEITNSTFSGNSSGAHGGAIMNVPTITNDIRITNSTFVGNSAPYGGAYMQMGSSANPQPIFLINSLFYGNTASLGGSQIYSQQATSWTVYNSLIESTSAGQLAGVYTDCIIGVDPLLGALADNGGFTKTYSIGSGSPAINSGTTTSLLLDQRGFSIVGTRDIGAYEYRQLNTFTADGNWSDTANWSTGNPSENEDVIIADNVSVTLNVDDMSMNNFTLNTGATLVIPKDKELTVLGNFATNGSLSLESDGVDSGVLFIVGSTSGTITYKRGGLLANKWSIVTAPVSGQKILSFAQNVSNDIRTNTTVSPVRYAIASYDSSQSSNDAWQYYTANTSALEEFLQGESYSMSRGTDGEVSFTGSLNIENISKILMANRWSAIGNPYTTYLAANKNADSSFLNDNFASLHDTFKGIYIWNNAQQKYIAVTELDTDNRSFAPGQGFFIRMKGDQSNISFNKDKRQLKPATGTTVFEKNQTTATGIVVSVSNNSVTVKTNIKYFDTATKGLDPGYDIGNFNGASLDVFTHLLEGGNGVSFTIQSLPKKDIEEMVIPVGIKANVGTELTFTVDSIDLPTDLQVFIEDSVLNVFTVLNKASAYTVNIDSNMDGIGRFYIHTSSKALSTNDVFGLNNVMLYVKDATTLSISGLTGGQTKLKLYSLAGKQILKTTFEGSGEREVSIPSLSSGVYLVQLQTKEGELIKKIILE
jgi:hypothetical protein